MARLLTICHYELLPIQGGGALRSFHLLRQLAREHEVHAIIFQREVELRRETEGYKAPDSVRIYSPVDDPAPASLFDRLPRRVGPGLHYRWLRRSWRGPASGDFLRCHHLIRRILGEHQIDAVIFEYVGTLGAASLIRRLSPRTLGILNAHNVDHKLLAQEHSVRSGLGSHGEEPQVVKQTRWMEHHLNRYVHAVWACSEVDRDELASVNGLPGYVIPNGVDTAFYSYDDSPRKAEAPYLLFSGWLGTRANDDGVRFLVKEIWPRILKQLPTMRLLIVGGGASAELQQALAGLRQIEVSGPVTDVRPYFKRASVALVPLRIGSGTRLKILEAMSQGNPVVSSRKGAEGIEVQDGENILLADEPAAFAQAVIRLLADRARFDRMRGTARQFVESRYDWSVVGKAANRALEAILQRSGGRDQRLEMRGQQSESKGKDTE